MKWKRQAPCFAGIHYLFVLLSLALSLQYAKQQYSSYVQFHWQVPTYVVSWVLISTPTNLWSMNRRNRLDGISYRCTPFGTNKARYSHRPRSSITVERSPPLIRKRVICKFKSIDEGDNDSSRYRPHTSKATKSMKIGDTVFVPTKSIHGIIRSIQKSGWYTIEIVDLALDQQKAIEGKKKMINCRSSQIQVPTTTPLVSTTTNITDSKQRNDVSSYHDEETFTSTSILNLDELLLSYQNKDCAGTIDIETTTDQQEWDVQQLQHFQSVQEWVVFSDLHCSTYTIETCIEVLKQVHAIAKQQERCQKTGIIFLGDFWHIRSHNIRLDLFYQIMQVLQQHYSVPMILIPGNHDLLSSSASTNSLHSLLPFQNAYRLQVLNTTSSTTTSINGILILSQPTIFMNALFLPYIRSPLVTEQILHDVQYSKIANREVRIVLCHVDVSGASMNDNIVSQGGLSIQCFPPNIPIYSGHFHKPHNISSYRRVRRLVDPMIQDSLTTTTIDEVRQVEYVGSPYQVSLSESQQNKGIIILNNTNWVCLQRIPLHIGRRHYRPTGVNELIALKVMPSNITAFEKNTDFNILKSGDRIVLTIHRHDMDILRATSIGTSEMDDHITQLRNAGVVVEIREIYDKRSASAIQSVDANKSNTSSDKVDMSPSSLWSAYIAEEVQCGAISQPNEGIMLAKGKEILEEVDGMGITNALIGATSLKERDKDDRRCNFQLFSVTLRGFGPFRDEVTYPLFNRGLVLLRGSNGDGGSDSNGSGKTSLVMSILWAFTGSVDPRPIQDSKVSNVINDSSKAAMVSVEGELNGKRFSITRTKTASKGSLSFVIDGDDLSRQAIKDTQDIINETLGINPQVLARTMFNGQHALNELLEASDTKLKEELSLVVPLATWQEALRLSRTKLRDASKRIAELDGMISIRSCDFERFKSKLEEAKSNHRTESMSFAETTRRLQAELDSNSLNQGVSCSDRETEVVNMTSLEATLLKANSTIVHLEEKRETVSKQFDAGMEVWVSNVQKLNKEIDLWDAKLRSLELKYNEVKLQEAVSKERILALENMWKLDLSNGIPKAIKLPRTCPTCQQPWSNSAGNEDHSQLEAAVLQEITSCLARLSDEQDDLRTLQNSVIEANSSKIRLQVDLAATKDVIEKNRCSWEEQLQRIENKLRESRRVQEAASNHFAGAAKHLDGLSKLESINSRIQSAKDKLDQTVNILDIVQTEFIDCERQIFEFNRERLDNVEITRVMSDLCDAFGPRGIQTYIMKGAVSMLEFTTQTYLDILSDGTQRMELTLDSGDCIARKAYVRGEQGVYKERALASLSGGQWRRCSLAFTFAFASIVANSANFRPSLMVLDEPLTHLDQSGRSNVGKLIRHFLREPRRTENDMTSYIPSLGFQLSTILIILQDLAAEELEESFDAIDEVSRESGHSTLFIDR